MKAFLTACFAFYGLTAFSQRVVDVDKVDGLPMNAFYTVSGNPITTFRYVRLTEGSPFFRDNWMKGVVVTDQGKRYRSDEIKLNLIDNEVHFLTPKKEEFVCSFPLKEVVLTDSVSKDTFRFVHSSFTPALAEAKKGWYLPLVDGKASLYLIPAKVLQEVKPYNSSIAEQKIYTSDEFWLAHNGTVQKVKKPKDLLLMLAGRKAELEKFLKGDEIKDKSVSGQMTALVQYYNSLQ